MMPTPPPPVPRPDPAPSGGLSERMRSVGRALQVALLLGRGLLLVRQLTPAATPAQRDALVQSWSASVLDALGIRVALRGTIQPGQLLVANHVSWLDIIVLQALCPQARFVAKSDVRQWPVIGRLSQGVGTLFIDRHRPREAGRTLQAVAGVLQQGGTVVVFPEGTTSDGTGVLPFRPMLLQAARTGGCTAQPLALRYADPRHTVSPSVRYIDDDSLLQSIWWLCCARGVVATVQALPVRAAGQLAASNRKDFAAQLRAEIAAVLAR